MSNFVRALRSIGYGMSSIFEHMGRLVIFPYSSDYKSITERYKFSEYNSVEEALSADWEKVGNDMKIAMAKIESELSEEDKAIIEKIRKENKNGSN